MKINTESKKLSCTLTILKERILMSSGRTIGSGMLASNTELGKFIRSRRIELNLGQTALAEKTGIPQATISLIEIGKKRYLKEHQLKSMANILQCDPKELRDRIPLKPWAQPPKTELGKFVRFRREELGMSIETFAEKMGMTLCVAKNFELRNTGLIRQRMRQSLAITLDLKFSDLDKFLSKQKRGCSENKLGQFVRSRRDELNMSEEQLAEEVGVTRQYISLIELGRNYLSENDKMIKSLAKALHVNDEQLEVLRPKKRLKQRADNSNKLSNLFRSKRLELHLTQMELHEKSGVPISIICQFEVGNHIPNSETLGKLAAVLGCELPHELILAKV